MALETLLACLWAFLACVGFGLIYNIHGLSVLICGLGAALGWLVYQLSIALGTGDIPAAFLAAVVIGAYSEWMARLRRCPVTSYLQVALLPLVPGAGIYYAMRYCVEGYTSLFLATLLHTFGFAAALSVGAMLTSSILRALLPRVRWGGRPLHERFLGGRPHAEQKPLGGGGPYYHERFGAGVGGEHLPGGDKGGASPSDLP